MEKYVIGYLAKFLRMKLPSKLEEFTNKKKLFDFKLVNKESLCETKDDKFNLNLKKILRKISNDLEYIKQSQEEKDEDELLMLKWKYVTMVIDRLFFYLIIFYLFITFVSIILTSKNFFKFK